MLDKKSLQSFSDQNISEIFISFIQSGCSGTKISIQSNFEKIGLTHSPLTENLLAYYREDEKELLEGGYITLVKGKWIFSSEKIQDRCGCGSSFSFEKKLIDTSKLSKLQEIFGKKKGIHE